MGADSFGARADPTTDQLKWKKVLQCYMSYFNELHPRLKIGRRNMVFE